MSYAGSGPDESSCGGEVRERISANDRDLAAAGSKVNQDHTALLARNLHGEALRGVDGPGLKDARKASTSERKSEEGGGEEEVVHMPGSVTPHAKSRARVLLGWGAGLFVSHIVSGYMQELLFAVRGYTFGFYLTLGRYLVNALLAYLYLLLFDGSKLDTPAISIHNLLAQMRWLSSMLAKDGLAGVVSAVGTWQFLQRWARRWDRYMGIPKRKTDQFEEHDKEREEERSADEDLEHSADGPQSGQSVGDDFVGKEKVAQPGVTAISIEEEVTTARSAASGRVPIKYYLLLSFLSVMALGLSTSSLAYLNYPTKVILRTSKLVVIMLFSRFILGKKHTNSEYGMAMAMVFGLVLFTLGDYQVTSNAEATPTSNTEESEVESFEWKTAKGVFLLFLSLIFESININLQKKILVGYERSSPAEMVFYNALFGSLVTFAILLVNGELFSAWEFAMLHPETHYYILCFAFFSTCGVACAIMVLHNFDPMTIGIVVTGRKSITILTSFILIPKPISPHHITGGLLVFVSMFISAVWKSQEGASRPKDFAMD